MGWVLWCVVLLFGAAFLTGFAALSIGVAIGLGSLVDRLASRFGIDFRGEDWDLGVVFCASLLGAVVGIHGASVVAASSGVPPVGAILHAWPEILGRSIGFGLVYAALGSVLLLLLLSGRAVRLAVIKRGWQDTLFYFAVFWLLAAFLFALHSLFPGQKDLSDCAFAASIIPVAWTGIILIAYGGWIGVAGAGVGPLVAYLLRPSAPLVGQLPLWTVLTRGMLLDGPDSILRPLAEASFNYMFGGLILGLAAGIALAQILRNGRSRSSATPQAA
jgi:hypothetical protein